MADIYDINKDRWRTTTAPGPHMQAPLAIAVTPSDTKDVTSATGDNAPCYAAYLYVGSAGDVAVVTAADQSNSGQGTPVTYKSMAAGQLLPVQVRRVMSTNTTASQIVGHYHQ